MDYRVIKKGRGYVYQHANRLYRRVKTGEETKYLKCIVFGCDGSAKLVGDHFCLRINSLYLCLLVKCFK